MQDLLLYAESLFGGGVKGGPDLHLGGGGQEEGITMIYWHNQHEGSMVGPIL